jgi:hypothetical protein
MLEAEEAAYTHHVCGSLYFTTCVRRSLEGRYAGETVVLMRPFASSRDSSRRRRIRCRCSRFSLFSDPTSYLEAPSSSICHEHEGRQARDGNGWRACCRCWWWVCLCPFHRCAANSKGGIRAHLEVGRRVGHEPRKLHLRAVQALDLDQRLQSSRVQST